MPASVTQAELDDLVALAAPGWSATVEERHGRPMLQMTHPYSDGMNIVGRKGEVFDAVRCRDLLKMPINRERLRLMRDAPAGPSGRTVSGLLAFAEVFEWERKEVTAVASLLADSGAITGEEYEWLRRRVIPRLAQRADLRTRAP